MTSGSGLKCELCIAARLLTLSMCVKNQRMNRTRSILVNREIIVRELVEQSQCFIVILGERGGGDQPAEIQVRHRQFALPGSLRSEYLSVSIQSARQVAQTSKTFSAMMVNRGKLCILAPIGQNHIKQLKSCGIRFGRPSGEKLASLDACILCFVECATAAL